MVRLAPLLALWLCALAEPEASAQTQGKKYALLIGVKRYDHANLSPLHYTENDVVRLAALLKPQGYEVTLLSDSQEADRQPTKRNIEAFLESFVNGKVREDTVLFGFAGHGLQFEGDTSSYFLPRECIPTDRKSMVSLQMVYEKLSECGAGVRLMFVDACRNVEKGSARSALSEADPPKGVCAIFSCSKGQSAYEDNELRHGIFFYHLLDGLRGRAKDAEGYVTIFGLADYATRKVERSGYNQKPVMKGEVSNGVLMRVGRVDLKMPELPKRPVPYKEITNSLGMKLVYIAPGKFLMGTSAAEQEQLIRESGEPGDAKIWLDAEGPQHEVEITEGFYIGKYVVTQEEYQKLTGKNPSRFSATGEGARRVAGLETRRFPVEQVSWEEAKEFCRLLSAKEGKYYSLPTEAEWEYAARADTVTPYAFGTTLSPNQANVHDSKLERTDSVDHYPANPWGLCDVHGNVAQWCEDWYSKRAYKRGDCKDPEGPAVGNTRVTRGGRWNFSPFLARSACRYSCDPSNHDAGIGFRVVLRTTDKRIAKQQSPN